MHAARAVKSPCIVGGLPVNAQIPCHPFITLSMGIIKAVARGFSAMGSEEHPQTKKGPPKVH